MTIRRALVLTLGEFTDAQLPVAKRQPLIEKLQFVYENEPDAGLHGAAAWLLRKWEQRNRLQAVVEKLRSNENQLNARQADRKAAMVRQHAGPDVCDYRRRRVPDGITGIGAEP